MKIKTITYQKTFAIAPFLNEKIGVEIEMDDADFDRNDEAIKRAKDTVERWHKELNPQLFNGNSPLPNAEIPVTQIEKNISPHAKLIADMMTVTDLKVLESYKFIVQKSADLRSAYDMMLKKLTK